MIPNVGEIDVLTKYTEETLTMKLFSNNVTPGETDTAATYTEVVGGGYGNKSLVVGDRTIVGGAPSSCAYPLQNFTFTGPTNAPGTIYGYFIVNGSGTLKGVERFPSGVLPFTPVAGAQINITPKLFAS